MIVLAIALLLLQVQVWPPITVPGQQQPPVQQQDPAPAPGTGAQAQTPSQTQTDPQQQARPGVQAPMPVMTKDDFGTLLYEGGGVATVKAAEGGFGFLQQVWALPSFIYDSRKPENTVDHETGSQLNEEMVRLVAGLVLLGLLLVLGHQAFSVLRGEVPNPAVMVAGLVIVGGAAVVAVNNQWVQRFPIALVNLLLETISVAPLQHFVEPGLKISQQADQFWAGALAIALVLVALGLTVILFIEGAWCIVLGALMALWLFGSVLPIFGSGSQMMVRRWLGSLLSPVIALAALRLAAPTTGMIAGLGAPDAGMQLLMIAFLFVAWQAPGFVVGAISVSFPSIASMYFAGSLLTGGRISPSSVRNALVGRGGSAASGGVRQHAPRSRATLPGVGRASVRNRRTGSGLAAGMRPARV